MGFPSAEFRERMQGRTLAVKRHRERRPSILGLHFAALKRTLDRDEPGSAE